MDTSSATTLARLIRSQRIASLATLRQGNPLVTMVLYATATDFSAFYLHISRLAYHTQDIQKDPRVSLMIAETDRGEDDPQMLARVSFRGEAIVMATSDEDYEEAQARYLQRFPRARQTFTFNDFSLYRVQPQAIRYVAGFGQIFNPSISELIAAATLGTT